MCVRGGQGGLQGSMWGVPVLWRACPEIAHSMVGRQGDDLGSAKYRRLRAQGANRQGVCVPILSRVQINVVGVEKGRVCVRMEG